MDEGPADIMLMDIRMPVLNDIETTKIIRKKKRIIPSSYTYSYCAPHSSGHYRL